MAGANRPLWIIRAGKIEDHEHLEQYGKSNDTNSSRKTQLVDFIRRKRNISRIIHLISIQAITYLCTDGYADQFGGEKGKKLLSKRLRDYLMICDSPIQEQEGLLDDYYEEWRGNHEQVDDVLIIGIRYPEKG